ncbi:MAG: VCBS repeat-containing protein, partial [Verrucomicrobiota bacterium]|nr:VCBS repeat-containing protein [Verrucomicrobiota bacterium]
MKPLPLALGITAAFALNAAAAEYKLHTWTKHHITPHFWAEGGHFGDFNHDGEGDVVVGPYWYAGPDFKKRHTIYPDKVPAKDSFEIIKDGQKVKVPGFKGELSGTNGYSGNFLTYTYDFNSDGWKDVLVFGWPGKNTIWYENPKNKPGLWKANVIFPVSDGESPRLEDMNGDGKPEILVFRDKHL